MWPVAAKQFPRNNYIFQDDNAPIHSTSVVQDFKLKIYTPCLANSESGFLKMYGLDSKENWKMVTILSHQKMNWKRPLDRCGQISL